MLNWTESARVELERYLAQARAAAAASGADPEEVAGDLQRHLEQRLAEAGSSTVTREDLLRVLPRTGASDNPPAAKPAPAAGGPGRWVRAMIFLFGVTLPVITLAFELLTGLCGELFVDPIPTFGHALLIALVPLANAWAFSFLFRGRPANAAGPGYLNGVAIAVSAYYTLVFLPVSPFAVIGILYLGMGLLPLSPMISLGVALGLRRRLRRRVRETGAGPLPAAWRGAVVAVGLLGLLALPTILTQTGLQLGVSESSAWRMRGVRLLRSLGNREILLRSCYRRNRPFGDVTTWLFEQLGAPVSAEQAQRMYYRVTGTPYNAVRPPNLRGFRARAIINADDFDFDQAGDAVAGRLRGLKLSESRLDSRIEAASAVSYTEWTLVFQNDSARQQEARAQIALPPGAVVSRVTLWVDGEEREAAYAGRGAVKAAYQKVVQRRRDPVLVTTSGPDQVLLQCFPVPPNGGTIKTRIGITAPLVPESRESGLLRMPFFRERNFGLTRELRHSLWVESGQPLQVYGAADRYPAETLPGPRYARRAEISDDQLSGPCAAQAVMPAEAGDAWTGLREETDRVVRQRLETVAMEKPGRIVFVLDGSLGMASRASALVQQALDHLPPGTEAAAFLAGDEVGRAGESSSWPEALQRHKFRGGCDNVAALNVAWDLAAGVSNGVVVWLHGPQPVSFEGEEALLQRLERRPNGPAIFDLPIGAGPNQVAVLLNGHGALRPINDFGNSGEALARLLDGWAGKRPGYRYVRTLEPRADTPDQPEGSSHIARLRARDEALRLASTGKAEDRDEAVALAVRYRLVTPVSGAVVLETAEQYRESGLEPAASDTVPKIVPEPETWLLILAGVVLLALRSRLHRRHAVSPTI